MNPKYTCPVCGNPDLEEPPNSNFDICPCCGTEFGNSDYCKSHADLRAEWIAGGMKWWSACSPAPPGWSAKKQIENIGVAVP